jgi:hypothetical protein
MILEEGLCRTWRTGVRCSESPRRNTIKPHILHKHLASRPAGPAESCRAHQRVPARQDTVHFFRSNSEGLRVFSSRSELAANEKGRSFLYPWVDQFYKEQPGIKHKPRC